MVILLSKSIFREVITEFQVMKTQLHLGSCICNTTWKLLKESLIFSILHHCISRHYFLFDLVAVLDIKCFPSHTFSACLPAADVFNSAAFITTKTKHFQSLIFYVDHIQVGRIILTPRDKIIGLTKLTTSENDNITLKSQLGTTRPA